MEQAFDALRLAICDPGDGVELTPEDIRSFVENCTVALAVGGHGSRLQAITNSLGVNKNALRLPNGDTMLELTIRMYRDAGFRDFVALVYHQAESIVGLLGDGTKLGVRISYSYDPGQPVGRGGAIRNALDNGSIASAKNLIVHNPDDVVVNYSGSFPQDLVAAHIAGVRKGMSATAVMAAGLRSTYTGMKVNEGIVEEVMAYPIVPIPAHVGITAFDPTVYDAFFDLFDLTQKTDFEAVLFPMLVNERRLYTCFIPTDCWLQVNDPRALETLNQLVERRQIQ